MDNTFENKFEFEKSPMVEAYVLLNAKNPLELSQLYSVEDQKIMKENNWDYLNPELIINKIKTILEGIDIETISEEEKEWRNEILWFWYHHAISCAIWRYNDKQKAREFAKIALTYQGSDHPNKITKLLSLLIEDKMGEAVELANSVEDEVEKQTALDLVAQYKEKGSLFK